LNDEELDKAIRIIKRRKWGIAANRYRNAADWKRDKIEELSPLI